MKKKKRLIYDAAFTAFYKVRDVFCRYILDYVKDNEFVLRSNSSLGKSLGDGEDSMDYAAYVRSFLDQNKFSELVKFRSASKKELLHMIVELYAMCDRLFCIKTCVTSDIEEETNNIIIIRDARDVCESSDYKEELAKLLEQRIKFILSDAQITKKLSHVRSIIATIHLRKGAFALPTDQDKSNLVIECDVALNDNLTGEKIIEKNIWIAKSLLDDAPILALNCCQIAAPAIGKFNKVGFSDAMRNLDLLREYYRQKSNLIFYSLIGSQYERRVHEKFLKAADKINLSNDNKFVICTAESWGYGADTLDIEMILQCFANLAINDMRFWSGHGIFKNLEPEVFFEFIKSENIAIELSKKIYSAFCSHSGKKDSALDWPLFLLKYAYVLRLLSIKFRDKEFSGFISDDDEFHFISCLILFTHCFNSYLQKLKIDHPLYVILSHYGDPGRLYSITSWCSFIAINERNGFDIYYQLFNGDPDARKMIDKSYASFLMSRHIQFLYGGELGLLPDTECMALNNISGISNKAKYDYIPRFSKGSFIAFVTLFVIGWLLVDEFAPLTVILIFLSIIFGIHILHYPVQNVRCVSDGKSDFNITNLKRILKFANNIGLQNIGLKRRLELLEGGTEQELDELVDFEPSFKL